MKAIKSRRSRYDANYPHDPDLATALCYWCATLFLHPDQFGWLKMSKCPDCGGDDLRRIPFFTAPKFKHKWLRDALIQIQQAAWLSSELQSHERGFNRIVPPELIIKRGQRSQWTGGWRWEIISGPDWLRGDSDDPHGNKADADNARTVTTGVVQMVVPRIWTPPILTRRSE